MFDSIVAKEGKRPILIIFIIFLFLFIIDCDFLAFLSFVALLFSIFIYRFKYIDITALEKDKIYTPVSGKISSIDSDGFKKSITIDVGLCDLHILRSLEDAEVKITQKRGINLPLGTYKAKKLNEQILIEYDKISMEILSSLCNPSIKIEEKTSFKKGEKIGMFFHGKVIVHLDKDMQVKVKLGEKLISGKSVIATF
jgi:hypothetical protein